MRTLLGALLVVTAAPLPAASAGDAFDALCLPAGIAETAVCLAGGVWEGEPYVAGGAARPRVERVGRLAAAADLDGDGRLESAALVAASGAGTGSLLHLVVARVEDGVATFVAQAPIGDRVQVRALGVEGRELRLDVVRHGEGEPLCCPTRKATLGVALGEGGLAERTNRDDGALSIADLAGPVWRLVRLAVAEPAPAGAEVTLEIAGGRVAGRSGCNRYGGPIVETQPRAIEIGPLVSTRMACPAEAMALEQRVLAALGAARQYSFLGGELVLSGSAPDGAPVQLVFRAGPPAQ
jgi:heat shock protein HslJ